VPRVVVIQVAPIPTAVAMKSASKVINISRTGQRSGSAYQFLSTAAGAALPVVAAAA
jgi:hypothetical protein